MSSTGAGRSITRVGAITRMVTAGAVTAVMVGSAVALPPVALTAGAGPACGESSHLADIDGDNAADTAVGMPSYTDSRVDRTGAVDVHGTASGTQVLRAADLGAAAGEAGGFGSALAMADLDGDWCVDLVIGAPNEQSDAAAGGSAGPGQVYVVFGGPDGIDPADAVRLPRPATTAADGFGSSLALFSRREGIDDTRDHYLYVGAPGATVDGKADAGQVWRYRILAGGADRVTATRLEARHPGADGVPGAAVAGDRFGETLAQIDLGGGGVLVGVPGADVGTVRDAGAVWSMPVAASGALLPSTMWTQDSAGVPGRAETGDRFGTAIGSRAYSIVVGVPGEDVGSVRDAGLVQVFALDEGSGTLTAGAAITQDARGIPGRAEAGDRFGAAVGVGASLAGMGSGKTDAAIGVPGEDLGRTENAGTIALVAVSDRNPESGKALRQGAGLTGKPETGDALGSVLAVGRGPLGFDEDYTDLLLIGVPAEDVGGRKDAGMFQRSPLGLRSLSPNLTFSGGHQKARNYGQVLPSSAD